MFQLLAAATAVVAQAQSGTMIEMPDWVLVPEGGDVARYYPEQAQRRNIEGRAVAICQVTAEGALTSCFIADESPKDQHFGDALLRVSQIFRMKPLDKAGVPTAGRWVKLPLRFRLPRNDPNDQSESLVAEACYGQIADLAETDGGSVEVWKASLFWYARIVQSVANTGGGPSTVEAYATSSREAAHDKRLVAPKGWDRDACLAKASGK